MLGELVWCDFSLSMERLQEGWPFGAKDVGTCEGTVTATDDEGVNAFFDEVVCG